MSLASPSRINRSKEGWNAIQRVVDFTHAVGRIGNRGSCILISVPVPANSIHGQGSGNNNHLGVLLTTSFVLHNREVAKNLTATFFENPVTGSGAKGVVKPISVQLRADTMFLCSARTAPKRNIDNVIEYSSDDNTTSVLVEGEDGEEDLKQVEELGYTVLACNLNSDDDVRSNIRSITPLPLPLILSSIPEVHVGDTHLLVTHENSAVRRYVVVTVTEVHEHHCTYDYVDPVSQFASGGSVFNVDGEFIGIQHQCGDSSYCIFMTGIVSHLFESGTLGLCRIPVLSADTEDARDEEGELNPNADISDLEFNEPFQVTQRGRLFDVGAGDQIVSFEEIEIVRKRKANGTARPDSVRIRRHTEIWNFWTSYFGPAGTATYYRGLILLLAAFPYQSKLCTRILAELTSHENRNHIVNVSSYGGVGIMLEVLDSHPHDQALVQTAITSLARVSLYDSNKQSIARSEGVPVIIAVMREFMVVYDIQQWAFYMLLNLLLDGEDADGCAQSLLKYAGLEVMVQSLQRHSTCTHLQRWGWQCLGLIAMRTSSTSDTFLILRGLGAIPLLVSRLEEFWKDSFVSYGIAFALHKLLKIDETFPAVSTVSAQELMDILLPMSLPLHKHQIKPADEDDEELDTEAVNRLQQAEHLRLGCSPAPSVLQLIFELMEYHSGHLTNDSGPLLEYLLLIYLDFLSLRNNLVGLFPLKDQEDRLVRVTQAFMTEARMHMVAEKVLRCLGVPDPFARYSHLQRDRNPNSFKEL